MPKRCPNGSRRNKKTKQCVRKSAMGKKKRCPKGSRRNPKTKQCVRKSKMKKSLTKAQKNFLKTIKETPRSINKGVITGVKTMEKIGQSTVNKTKKIVDNTGSMIDKALRDGLITEKQRKKLPPHLVKAIINKKRKKGGKRGG